MKALKGLTFCLIVILALNSVVVGASSTEIQSTIYYVKPGGTGDCLGWSTACELQTALSLAEPGDQIWVAAGGYRPSNTGDREATFQLESGVAIYGGFPYDGGGWDDRDRETNITVLSGDLGILGVITDNSYHVVTGNGVDETALLDGFMIMGGYADGSAPHNYGGGMYNNSSSPSLSNITFYGNSADYGGGMYNNTLSNPTLSNITFTGNSAAFMGGGLCNFDDSSPTLTNVTFSGNSASGGGGILNDSSSPTLANITFSGNSAINGGGIYNNNSSPTLTNVTFSGNSASGGGAMMNSSSHPTMTNITFTGNSATNGGWMYNYFSNPILTNAIVWGNTPDQIYNDNSSPTITYSDIQGGHTGEGNIDANPILGSLANNGGFTQTHALGAGSPAIDAGNQAVCPLTDQRGFFRPIDGDGDGTARCDMGSYEYEIPVFYIYLPAIVN